MRIVLIHSFYRPSQPSGENGLVLAQIAALEKMGHEVVVISRVSPERPLLSTFAIRASIRVIGGRDQDIEEDLQMHSPDAIFLHNLFPNFGWKWVRKYASITTAFIHNYRFNCAAGNYFRAGKVCIDCQRSSRLRAIRHRCYRQSVMATIPITAVTSSIFAEHRYYSRIGQFVVGSEIGKHLLTSWGTPANWVHVIPNFTPQQDPIPASNSSLPWAAAGRLVPEKGIVELIHDFPSNKELRVFGSGPLEQEVTRKSPPNVSLHSNIPHTDLQLRMRQTSGVIVPSRWFEVNPVVAAEAFARSQPVIAFAANAVGRELYDINVNLVYETAEGLSKSISYVEQNYSSVQRAMRSHYLRMYSEHSWSKSISRLLV